MNDRPVADREPLSRKEVRRLAVEAFIDAHYEVRCDGALELAWYEAHPEQAAAIVRAHDAARAHPNEAGLRLAVGDLHRWDERKGWPAFNAILARIDAALAQPPVPVAGAEEGWVEHDGFATRVRPLHAAQPEDDGLARCPDCEHRQTEHATPGAECVHAFCSCDQALTLVLAALSESSEGVERRDGA